MTRHNPYQPPPIDSDDPSLEEKRADLVRHSNRIAASFIVCAGLTICALLMMVAFQEEIFLPIALMMAWMTLMIGVAWIVHRLSLRRYF